jgi:hypothetical protein
MTYRSDTDALEARLDVLQKDLAVRERERDEVARMLAEARRADEARRWLEARPRRRRRRILIATIGSTVMLLGGFLTYNGMRHESRRERQERVLHAFERFADEICKCNDRACADDVSNKMMQWGEQQAKDADRDAPYTAELSKQFDSVGERFGKCLQRAMGVEQGSASR